MKKKDGDTTFRAVESTQEALKQNIEESERLIERSQALIDRFRNGQSGSVGDEAAGQ